MDWTQAPERSPRPSEPVSAWTTLLLRNNGTAYLKGARNTGLSQHLAQDCGIRSHRHFQVHMKNALTTLAFPYGHTLVFARVEV